MEGIGTSDTNSILNFIDKLNPSIFMHVFLMDRIQKKMVKNPDDIFKKVEKKKQFQKILINLFLINLKA